MATITTTTTPTFKVIKAERRNQSGPFKTDPATDLTRWRLSSVEGRQTWTFVPEDEIPEREQTLLEQHSLGLDTSMFGPPLPKPKNPSEAAYNGLKFFTKLQAEDGHWTNDLSGPLFVTPGLVIVSYITKTSFTKEQTLEMIRYLKSVQCPDGGWGIHVESPPTVCGCALNYVQLRLLGVSPDDPVLIKARHILHKLGGAAAIPSFGKFWLSILNVYSWEGMHSLCPEMWLLPTWLPIHPSKLLCHCRQLLLAMGFCYGKRICAEKSSIIRELRTELYVQDYDTIDWPSQRDNISKADLFTPHHWLLDMSFCFLDFYEAHRSKYLRDKALDECYDHICADNAFTKCIGITAVAFVINMLARWFIEGPDSSGFQQHQYRVQDYLWMGLDGMKMALYGGSAIWDTSLAVQGLLEANADERGEFLYCLKRAHNFLKISQIPENPPNYQKYYRDAIKGGFSVSTRDNGWLVSDCTAEALKSVMYLEEKCQVGENVSQERLYEAVDILLDMDCGDGQYAPYEKARGSLFLENLNPHEIFADCMVEHVCVECTSSVLRAFKHFTEKLPNYRAVEIRKAMVGGLEYIRRKQRTDGSWEGSWGVCFTYGAWFALEAYGAMGYSFDNG